MKPRTKKFAKWLLIADGIFIAVMIIVAVALGAASHGNAYNRGYVLGQGIARFLVFSNLVAALIFYFATRNKE